MKSFNFTLIKLCHTVARGGTLILHVFQHRHFLVFLFDPTAKKPEGWFCVCVCQHSVHRRLYWGQASWRKNCSRCTRGVCVVSQHICVVCSYREHSTMNHRAWECKSLIGAANPCLIRYNFLAERERWSEGGNWLYACPAPPHSFCAPLTNPPHKNAMNPSAPGDPIAQFKMATVGKCSVHTVKCLIIIWGESFNMHTERLQTHTIQRRPLINYLHTDWKNWHFSSVSEKYWQVLFIMLMSPHETQYL